MSLPPSNRADDPVTGSLSNTGSAGSYFAHQVGAFVGAASQLVVWNILTRGTWWTLPLTVSCLAVNPAGEHFAAVVTNLASAAEADDGQQLPEAAGDARGCQAVLTFRPDSPQPIHSWASRQPLSAALFAQPSTALHIAAARITPQVHGPPLRCLVSSYHDVSSVEHKSVLHRGLQQLTARSQLK